MQLIRAQFTRIEQALNHKIVGENYFRHVGRVNYVAILHSKYSINTSQHLICTQKLCFTMCSNSPLLFILEISLNVALR